MSSALEHRGEAPVEFVSILSYALADALGDTTLHATQRQRRLKRQLLFHHTDIICIQGLNTNTSGGAYLTDALATEGYEVFCSCSTDEANAIFWDRSRLESVSHVEQAATLAVDLRLLGSSNQSFRVVCLQGKVRYDAGLGRVFGTSQECGRSNPLIVCADLQALGGAECAAVVEELGCLQSV